MPEALPPGALDQLFREARSYSQWLDREVTEEQMREIHALLKLAPTSANQQPARLVWCRTRLSGAATCLQRIAPVIRPMLVSAPAVSSLPCTYTP